MLTINNRLRNALPHIIGIIFILLLPLFVFGRTDNHLTFWVYNYYYHIFFTILIFYGNFLYLTPRLYFRPKKVLYALSLLTFMIFIVVISQYGYYLFGIDKLREPIGLIDNTNSAPKQFFIHPRLIDNFFLYLLVLGASLGAAIIKRQNQNEKEQQERDKAHQDTELAFLKNQISPHFFFNALNNIYALIAIDGDKAQKSVEKLSGLMRYLIYESDIKLIELNKEFDFTRNYIELMRQRLNSKVSLDVDIQENVANVTIPPLLFIPFIENTFKHGVSYREKSFIKISLKTEKDKLRFNCENSISQHNSKEQNKKGGLGIKNVKKRLDLMYGDKAQLKMDIQNNTFIVELVIPI
ncbi:sensor histidine kinase [Labilibaculum sp.]|uniref:sensor histidine kinase n=1 Tax=Labilibaculum sp. TaxID=2060723 RepID=UPI003563F5FF